MQKIIQKWLVHFDRWCTSTGRKLEIRNGYTDEVTLVRYSLFPTKSSPTSPSREPRWGNIYLHKFVKSEEFDLHDHPWSFLSFIIKGAYLEHLPDNKKRLRKAGSLTFFPANWTHSVELEPGTTCWTIVVRGKHVRQWGYHTSSGWVPARAYLDKIQRPTKIEGGVRTHASGPIIQDDWKTAPQHILLIGDDGLLCPHMADHLMDYHPTAAVTVISRGTDAERIRDSIRFTRQTLANKIHLLPYSTLASKALKETLGTVDTIIYFDAHAPQSHQKPETYLHRGSLGVLHALELSASLSAKRFTLASSGDVHGPLESHRPYHPYDRTKPWSIDRAILAGAESLVQAWSQQHEGVFTIVRTPDVFGERMPLNRTVGYFLQQLNSHKTVNLRGRRTPQGGTALSKHQYLHARDTARAILHATMNGGASQLYHLGGEELDDADFLDCLSAMTGQHPKVQRTLGIQPSDGHRFALEDTLGKELNWKAPHGFETSLRNTLDWMFQQAHQRWLQSSK